MLDLLKRWFQASPPLPEHLQHCPLNQIPWAAIDLELTSLDSNNTEILSVGWVKGTGNQIALNECQHHLIDVQTELNQSPVIHGLTAESLQGGEKLQWVLEQLLNNTQNCVWVFHNAQLDMTALESTCQQFGLNPRPRVTLDTLKLAAYQLHKTMDVLPPNGLTLSRCRERLNLPAAPAHNALDDAMATLQLLYALLDKLTFENDLGLAALQHTKAITFHR